MSGGQQQQQTTNQPTNESPLTLNTEALLAHLKNLQHKGRPLNVHVEGGDDFDEIDEGENSEIISEHLQQLGSRLELGFPGQILAEGDQQSEEGSSGAKPSWAALASQSLLHADQNARSTYLERLPIAGTVRQSQRGSVAGEAIAPQDAKSVDDQLASQAPSIARAVAGTPAFSTLRESPLVGPMGSPDASQGATTAVTPPPTTYQQTVSPHPSSQAAMASTSADLASYIRLVLPSGTLAQRARLDSETVNAVRLITQGLNMRSRFTMKYHVYDSPVVHPRSLPPPGEVYYGSREPIFCPQDCPILPNLNGSVEMEDGVLVIRTDMSACPPSPHAANVTVDESLPILGKGQIPSSTEFVNALNELMAITHHPAVRTLAFQRLRYLEERFSFHLLFNGNQEIADVRNNNHRDFYNVRKVDTHVHHSASMTQKHLLRFIRRKYRMEGNTVVAENAQGEPITLAEIFQHELGLSAWETSIDHLNVHALNSCFHRFDLFNNKYNPFGTALLREVFLKTDNRIGGRYLAELTREVMDDLEEQKYQHVEWRISIYGHSKSEWKKLALWIKNNKLYSKNVRWIIQVPRLYHVYRKRGVVSSMKDFLSNVFEPVAEAILRPQDHPEIFEMLHSVVGWDSVDDESVSSKFTLAGGNMPLPEQWTGLENPPYAYWCYYMYANIRALNLLLQKREMNAMPFRPHCGETGSVSHLAAAGLLADGINHGIMLRKSPVLQYLYYLWQVGLAMSPLSNNALFHEMTKSPVNSFFRIGLNVSLSSDDPLMFHFTDEALLEEYSVCAHVWKLTPVDLCELARNSVLQSSFEPQYKRHWVGPKYYKKGPRGNKIECTNVPDMRLAYREETLKEELKFLRDVLVTFDEEPRESPVTRVTSSHPASQEEE